MKEEINHSISEANEVSIIFLGQIMGKATDFVRHFDYQTNILVGIGTAVTAFSITNLNSANGIFYILGSFSLISVLVGLFAIHPPMFMRKRQQKESLFYNKKICKFDSPDQYAVEIKKILENKDDMINEYCIEIRNLYKYYYQPKRKLFKISRNLLFAGISISSLLFLVQLF